MIKEGIRVKGHKGTWYVIDELIKFGQRFYLLEHERYGNDALWIAIDSDGKLIMEDISDGIDELSEYLEENYK